MDLSQSKWRLIFGLVLGLVILVVIVVVAVVLLTSRTSDKQGQCLFTDVKPSLEKPGNVASDTFTALASFSGFLGMYKDGKELYLPLNLVKLSAEQDGLGYKINLWTDCAIVSLHALGDPAGYNIDHIDVNLERPADLGNTSLASLGRWRQCRVGNTDISFSDRYGFSCNKPTQRTCPIVDNHKEMPLVVLMIQSIRFEIDGDSRLIRRGLYSKPPRYC